MYKSHLFGYKIEYLNYFEFILHIIKLQSCLEMSIIDNVCVSWTFRSNILSVMETLISESD